MNSEEQFWQGDFGNDYTARNINFVENNYQMFGKIFCYKRDSDRFGNVRYKDIKSIIEFGCGTAMNLKALQRIFPNAIFEGWEINNNAIKTIIDLNKNINVVPISILDCDYENRFDLILSKGLLIHISPENINRAYQSLYNTSKKYILIAEYYNPIEVEINYRGNTGKLWKRDDYGNLKKLYPNISLLDYGFISKYSEYPQDDLNWWLIDTNKEN